MQEKQTYKNNRVPSRRQFLTAFSKSARNIANAAECITVSHPAILMYCMLPRIRKESQTKTPDNIEKTPPTQDWPYTDLRHTFEDGTILRNIGVSHSHATLNKHGSFFANAIKDADIICLEGIEKMDNNFFQILTEYANNQGKTAILIDSRGRPQLYLTYGFIIAGCALGTIAAFNRIFRRDKELQKPLLRRTMIRSWAWISAYVSFPSLLPEIAARVLNVKSSNQRNPLDIGYVTDGGSVKMLSNLYKVIKENPGSNILSVTGDFHARDIEYYLKAQTEFKIKETIYNNTYFNISRSLKVKHPESFQKSN